MAVTDSRYFYFSTFLKCWYNDDISLVAVTYRTAHTPQRPCSSRDLSRRMRGLVLFFFGSWIYLFTLLLAAAGNHKILTIPSIFFCLHSTVVHRTQFGKFGYGFMDCWCLTLIGCWVMLVKREIFSCRQWQLTKHLLSRFSPFLGSSSHRLLQ